MRPPAVSDAPPWLLGLSIAFVLGLLALVASSFLRPAPASYAPTAPAPREVGEATVEATYTVDAGHPDRWVFFDFSRRSAVTDPGPLDWDLAFRRFHVVTNGGRGFAGRAGAREAGDLPLAAALVLPGDGYVPTEGSLEEDARHPVLEGWYDYGFLTHLLTPRPVTYAVRTADGRRAALRFVAYYCPGARPGCVTFRYRYRGAPDRPGDRGRSPGSGLRVPAAAGSSEPPGG